MMICISTGVECEFAIKDGCRDKGHDDCPELTATRDCECEKGIKEEG